MSLTAIINSDVFKWVIIPLLIFSARVIDVSLGTLRIIFMTRGHKYIAPMLGFFEVLIWLSAIQQIFLHLTNPVYYIVYALGFAMGNYVGIMLEDHLSIGKVLIRIITRKQATELESALQSSKYISTTMEGHSPNGKVKIILLAVDRKKVASIIPIIKALSPNAFYSIEDIRSLNEPIPAIPGIKKEKNTSVLMNTSKKK
jgi:uncharacterized protein YebE (UPF0316 family)